MGGSRRQPVLKDPLESRGIYTPGLGAGRAVPAHTVAVCPSLADVGRTSSSPWGGADRLHADVRDCGLGFGERVAAGRHLPSRGRGQWGPGCLSHQWPVSSGSALCRDRRVC